MGKVNKSKTVTCPFYYVFTAQSKGRFTQILLQPAHSPAPLTVHILRIWQQSAYGWLRPPRQLYCHIWSSKAAPAQPSPAQPSPAQPPAPDTGAGDAAGVKLEAGPQSSGTLDRTHSFTTFADFTPPLKGVGSLKNWKSSFNLLYSFHIHFMFWNENKIDLTIIMVYKFSTILFHCFH